MTLLSGGITFRGSNTIEVWPNKYPLIDGQVSIHLIHCLIAIIKHIIEYCKKVHEKNGINLFWPVINSLKSKGLLASVSTYDFFILCTTLPCNIIKKNLPN